MILKLIKKIFKRTTLGEVLARELPHKVLSQISAEIKDRREIFEIAGKYYQGGAEALARRAAASLGFKYIEKIESEKMPAALQSALIDLKNLGACPIVKNTAVIALVCVDPELLKSRYKLPENFPLLLSSWSNIRCYWSEQAKEVASSENSAAQLFDLKKVLLALVQIVLEKNESELQVHCAKPYHYKIAALNGQISAEICERMAICFAEQVKQSFNLGNCGIWECNWQKELKVLKIKRESVLQTEDSVSASDAQFNYRIMIVDDSSVFSQVLRRFLKDRNYKIEEYNKPELALRHLKSGDLPHLLISDLNMPKISGKELVRAVREDSQLRKLPVVILTSQAELEVRMELISKGADAFISKSDDPRLLAVQVQALLERFYGEAKCSSA